MKQILEELKLRYQAYINNVQWHIDTNKPEGAELKICNQRLSDWKQTVREFSLLLEEHHPRFTGEIGELLTGEHPDEINPRAETWLQERRNWEEEVNKLKTYIAQLERRLCKSKKDRIDYFNGEVKP